jgi:hypothetical protein
VRMSEDKVRRKDMCWFVGIFLGLRELPGVGGPGLGEAGPLQRSDLLLLLE